MPQRQPRRSPYFTTYTQSEENRDHGDGITSTRYYRDDTGELIAAAVYRWGWSQTGNLFSEEEIAAAVRELGGQA